MHFVLSVVFYCLISESAEKVCAHPKVVFTCRSAEFWKFGTSRSWRPYEPICCCPIFHKVRNTPHQIKMLQFLTPKINVFYWFVCNFLFASKKSIIHESHVCWGEHQNPFFNETFLVDIKVFTQDTYKYFLCTINYTLTMFRICL